jgi:thiol-disulfide isomerase/thioredoxin
MDLLQPGTAAPPIDGVQVGATPTALWFFKTTCPVCRMAAPKAQILAGAYPGHVTGVGQDPPERLAPFAEEHAIGFPVVEDPSSYPASTAYGIQTVPTLFVVDGTGTIVQTVESWDRDGYNRASALLAELTGAPARTVSEEGDGLPVFRPG